MTTTTRRRNLPKPGTRITRRETHIIAGLARGHSNAQIAENLHLSPLTVKSHVRRLGERLKCGGDRAAIVVEGYRLGILASLSAEPRPGVALTPRNIQILQCMAGGLSVRQIAVRLQLSEDTVRTHKYRLYDRLDAANCAHALALAFQHGLIPMPQRADTPGGEP